MVTGDGTACVASFQAGSVKARQRFFSNSGSAPMGFDLPAAIGAAIGGRSRRVICITGDGSIMMNLQELQTIRHHRLPVKIFLLNNGGYHSIRQTQRNFFPDREVGSGPASGVGFPDFGLVAVGHGLLYRCLDKHTEMDAEISACLDSPEPALCEVTVDREQAFAPRIVSRRLDDGRIVSAALEDMSPFLEPEEISENCRYLAEARMD